MLPSSYLVLIVTAIVISLLAFKGIRGGAPPVGALTAALCVSGIFGLAMVIFAMYFLMIGKFGERFTEQALLAAQNWETHATGSAA